MVVRKCFTWLLCAAVLVAVAPAAQAKWTPMLDGTDPSSSPWIGPGGSASPDPKGGADPDEPLGPERMAGTRSETIAPVVETTWMRLVMQLLRLDSVSFLGR